MSEKWESKVLGSIVGVALLVITFRSSCPGLSCLEWRLSINSLQREKTGFIEL